jgi:hypothetical protein
MAESTREDDREDADALRDAAEVIRRRLRMSTRTPGHLTHMATLAAGLELAAEAIENGEDV